MEDYSSSLEEFSFFICVVAKPAPIATPTPMPNAILFRETPIAMPIASPEPHPIKLYVKSFIIQSTNNHPHKNGQCIASAFRTLLIIYFQGY